MASKQINILMVEDNPGDIRLTQETFRETNIKNKLHVVRDGVEAMEFLHRRGKYGKIVKPDLILLDLNLPKKHGSEVLADIKNDKNLHRIPVIVLTTSSAEEDILKAYNLHANCYITKPIELDQLIHTIHGIKNFWLDVVKLSPI